MQERGKRLKKLNYARTNHVSRRKKTEAIDLSSFFLFFLRLVLFLITQPWTRSETGQAPRESSI